MRGEVDEVVPLESGEKSVNGGRAARRTRRVRGQDAWKVVSPEVGRKDRASAGAEGKRGEGRGLAPGQPLAEAVVGVERWVAG